MMKIYNCDRCMNQYTDPERLTTVEINTWERDKYERTGLGKWEPEYHKYCPECTSIVQTKGRIGFKRG